MRIHDSYFEIAVPLLKPRVIFRNVNSDGSKLFLFLTFLNIFAFSEILYLNAYCLHEEVCVQTLFDEGQFHKPHDICK